MNTAEYLNTLIECKEDMKVALIEQGAPPTGGLSTYADAIDNIVIEDKIPLVDGTIFFNTASNIDFSIFDFSTIKNCNNFCYNMEKLTEFNVTTEFYPDNMSDMFENCTSLNNVCSIDASNVEYCYDMFYKCKNLKNLGGLINLGKNLDLSYPTITTDMFIGCTNLTHESILNIFNNLYDMSNNIILQLQFEPNIFNMLSAEDIAIATNKGWAISSY